MPAICLREVPAPEVVAELLRVTPGDPVVVRRRIIELDGEPCELTDTHYPVAIARGTPLAETKKIRGGAVTLLAELGHIGVHVREDVTARMPDGDERTALNLDPAEPVLRLNRVTLDAGDRPIQADMMVMPAHRQQLRYEIMSGDLVPGSKLPSTNQLKERFEASNATIQKALQLLKEEGLVIGRAGAAVTVREHRQRTMRPASYMAPAPPGEPYRWLTEATRHGAAAHSTLLKVAEVRPPADVSAALNLAADETALLRQQILTIDDEPVELVKSYYPLGIARGTAITGKRKVKGGTPSLLAELGYPPRLSVDRVSARVPTQEQFQALQLPSDLPVLRTLRVVHSDDDLPIEVTVMVKAGHLYEMQYEFTPE